jgi:hypothetical protein
MSSPLPVPPPDFDQLSYAEQVEWVEQFTDYETADENYVKIPEWHLEMLEERIARQDAAGRPGRSWEEVKQELIKEGLFKVD